MHGCAYANSVIILTINICCLVAIKDINEPFTYGDLKKFKKTKNQGNQLLKILTTVTLENNITVVEMF
jgi:hypothetical protein